MTVVALEPPVCASSGPAEDCASPGALLKTGVGTADGVALGGTLVTGVGAAEGVALGGTLVTGVGAADGVALGGTLVTGVGAADGVALGPAAAQAGTPMTASAPVAAAVTTARFR
ncbi:hypothetical protein [Streptomyces xantholiticus]|uniref:hypothetical protein n=1 Tax=Streptomyces xantholiticus TaxID=68285 RepID=UPI0016729CB4|nr:hypothetical protein [Streptomyces xantholiticus]GGW48548.1 hypothetical protein GCM10010381_37470 [Streptomyces xantholiticus]